jgi:putative membrane-bound dehydrogenase-like protein
MKKLICCIIILTGLIYSSCDNKGESRLSDEPRRIEILFLGHSSKHHNSAQYLPILAAALGKEGINFTYTDDPADLNPQKLAWYDGLMIYANHDSITQSQEDALLNFVKGGRGFIPLHCASWCFRNSEKYVDLVGGQFLKHDTATFTATIINKEHPVMQGVEEFAAWDETYVHDKLSSDRMVLMERVEGDHHEPWTWVKEHGKGRVFYTASGHDERVWDNPGFQKLVKQGIVWAVGNKVKSQWEEFRKGMPTLVYKDVPNIPNYEKRNPAPQYQEPLAAEEEKKLIQVPAGFRAELFASEPDIINPIAMDWDDQGRLWVIETVDYPNSVRDENGVGDDRIKICEDTDGDGNADKFTVFADKLNIPTSLTFARGGIIVSQAPHFLFLKDTDGDDRADVREILIDGWGTFDTHAGPSNLKYGIDNQIWGSVGYSGFKGKIAGDSLEFEQGFYHFAPDASSFQFLTNTSNNTWGLGLTENNDVFGSTANNTHSVFMGIPNQAAQGVEGISIGSKKIDGHYAMHPITPKVRQVDVFGGFTAAAGHNFYTARTYPKEYWNNIAFVCEPTGHLVHIAKIERDGSGFIEKDGWNLFAGADEWTSPVEAKVGPDGNVWVLDWYNFIIQHNPTPTPDRGGYQAENGSGNAYENPLRDKSHGRVWRIVHQDSKSYRKVRLDRGNSKELVATLSNDNMFWRIAAQRMLVENKKDAALPFLYELVKGKSANPYAPIHALWTMDGLGAVKTGSETFQVVVDALKHSSPAVRKAALQILSQGGLTEQIIIESNTLNDPDPNTRLAAFIALTSLPASENIGALLLPISKDPTIKNDLWLQKAVYAAAAKHQSGFMSAFLKENPTYKAPLDPALLKREQIDLDDTAWKQMPLPKAIETNGVEMDGIIWFRKTIDIPENLAGKKAMLSLGPIDDTDIAWVNGVKVGSTDKDWDAFRLYAIPAGVLKAGKNSIAVKVEDGGGRGGMYGRENDFFLQSGTSKISLVGDWKYDVEKIYRSSTISPFQDASVAEVFMKNYANKSTSVETTASVAGATIIRIKVIKNEMKYDLKSFTVEAGKPVEIIFENPDFMQHNLLIIKPGTLQTVGAAADKLAQDSKGAEMNYIPNIPEILFSTKLVNPQQTVRLQFTAPKEVGDYPYVCTFPGHWSLMNGIMNVVKSK